MHGDNWALAEINKSVVGATHSPIAHDVAPEAVPEPKRQRTGPRAADVRPIPKLNRPCRSIVPLAAPPEKRGERHCPAKVRGT